MAAIVPDLDRATEIVGGIQDVITRDPEEGYQVNEAGIWGIKTRYTNMLLVFFYSFDDDTVTLESVRVGLRPVD